MSAIATLKPVHGAPHNKPWPRGSAPQGFTETAPEGCDLQVGDRVRFTNEYGASCDLTVLGFCNEPEIPERVLYIFTDCWWFPAKLSQVRKLAA